MRLGVAAIIGLLALVISPGAARAGDPIWSGRRPTILTLIVNEVPHGETLVLLHDGDALVVDHDLRRAGVAIGGAVTATIRDRAFVSLRSLGIRFVADEAAMAIRLSVAADLLGTTRLDLGSGGAPRGVTYQGQTSAYMNYAIHAARDVDLDRSAATFVNGFGEVGVRLGGALAHSTVTATLDDAPVRGLSNVTWDDRGDRRRLILGDQLASGGGLGGAAVIGGVHLARAFELDPYLATAPTLELRGAVLVPSTAEIYVDGALVRTVDLPPGSYDLSNVPAAVGAGATRVVVRDPLGRTQEVSSRFYLPAGLLRDGLSDYALSAGFRRAELATASFDYCGPVAVARYRRGVDDRLTLGVRSEASLRLASGGATASLGTALGQVELGASGSVDRGQAGGAAALAWAFLGRRGGASLTVRALSARYATLELDRAADRPRIESRLSGSRALGRRLGLGLQLGGAVRRDGGWSSAASVHASLSSTRGVTLSTTLGVDDDDRARPAYRAVASLSVPLGAWTRGSVAHEQAGPRRRDRVDLHRTIPRGRGVGYRLAAQDGDRDWVSGELEAQTRVGRYQLGYRHTARGGHADASVAGGVALIGGSVFATRSIERSLVLVRVPGAPRVRVYLDHQPVGRTDAHGELLVTEALPYYANRLAIEPADLPDDRPPTHTSTLLAPPDRGGAVLVFHAPRLRVVRGVVQVERGGHRVAPAYGELVVGALPGFDDPESQLWTSPLGSDGEFEINSLPTGGYPAVIVWSDGACTLTLDVPASDAPIIDLGTQVCVVAAAVRR